MGVKVGDSVRLTHDDSFGAYKRGDIVNVKNAVYGGVYFDDNDGDERYAPSEWFEPVAVAPQQQPLRIKAGAYYRTRDGRKVGPAQPNSIRDEVHPWNVPHDGGFHGYTAAGESCLSHRGSDLIAEWTDEPVSSNADPIFEWIDEPATTLSSTTGFTVPLDAPEFGGGASAVAEFKVGDRVETHGDFSFDPGFGTITKVDGNLYVVTVDDHGSGWNYYASELRLVAEATNGKDTINRVPWVKQAEENVSTIADIVRRLEALEDKAKGGKITIGGSVTLDAPAKVTGIDKHSVNIVLASGGSYALPLAALRAA